MAKRMKRLLAVLLALTLCIGTFAASAAAAPWGNGWGNQFSDQYEWYQVYVQGNLVASGRGEGGDMYYLGTHYSADISASGPIVNWYINTHGGHGNAFSGTADLRNYITVPEGFTVKDYEIVGSSVDGVNSAAGSAYFDNAIISITIKTIYNEETGEEIEIPTEPEVTEPEATETEAPTEPEPVRTSVTVNHLYYTYDAYTGETVLDGETSDSEAAIEGQSYTATAVTSYNGNEYEQLSVAPALSITIAADAAENVVNISYMRTIDTTPAPVQTSVTVNHLYYTYDIYTGETVLDGETSGSEEVIEGQSYTATAVTSYNENEYEQLSVAPAMSITIVADAAENVIHLSYLRTIDTTPVEPDPTEPPATEPPATEPPATEPPATEPPATEPPATEPPATEPTATTPPTTTPPATERPVPPAPAVINEEIDIFDEDVPLADAPKTGDISALWIAISGISAAGMIILGKKREDDET